MNATIRFGHSAHGPANTPMVMAQGLGFFAEHGLTVETVEIDNTAQCVARLLDGTVDVAAAPGVPVLNAALRGADVIVLLSCASRNLFGVIGSRRIHKPADLRGGVVGTTARDDQGYIMLQRALREWGLDPQRDVETREVSSRGAEWDAVVAGSIDAFATTIPQQILARRRGQPVLRDFMDTPEPYQLGGIVTTRRFAYEDPERTVALLRAMVQAYRRFQRDFATALPFLKERTKLDDVEVLAETHRILCDEFDRYEPSPQPLEAVRRDLAASLGEPVDVDVSRLVDPSFARQV